LLYAALAVLFLTGFYPIHWAWHANRWTTLRHTVVWMGGAWMAWFLAACMSAAWPVADAPLSRYFALCLTGCAAAAVLGARRPGMGAWNFVAAGLLAVLLLPVAIQLGEVRLNAFDATFLSGALAVGFLNHLPTRFAAVMLMIGAACALEMGLLIGITGVDWTWGDPTALALLVAAPWLGLTVARRGAPADDEFNREWLAFRDRFGMVWALPARDQFNRAAGNGQWGVVLDWKGLRPAGDAADARLGAALAGLRGVLKRFGSHEDHPASSPCQ
jgi:hypothetical protein